MPTCTASVKLAVWKNKPIRKQEKNCYRAKMWYVIPEVTSCVFVFIGSVYLTVLLVSSRHGWYHRLDHACVTWINSSRDISFLLVQILARDHGSLGLSVWSIDATISPIFSSFSVSLCVGAPHYCGGSVILLPTGWFIFFLVHVLQPWPFDMWPSHHTPAYPVQIDAVCGMRVYIQQYTREHMRPRMYIVDSGSRFARGVLWHLCYATFGWLFFHRALSVIAMWVIGSCLSTSSRRLLLCCWATPVGSSSAISPSFTTVL